MESLLYCQKGKGLINYAWVLITNHIHMIIGSTGENNVEDITGDFKKFPSKAILCTLKADIQESRREWMLNRFEQTDCNDKKIKNFKLW